MKLHKSLFLNSSSGVSQNSTKNSDIIFYMKKPFVSLSKVKVGHFIFPVSFTNINSSNNKLYIDDVLYTIPIGNYTTATLLTALETLLTDYTITYSSLTNKYTFTLESSDFVVNLESTCLDVLGFSTLEETESSDGVLTSTYQVNLSGNNVIYIDVPTLSTENVNNITDMKTSIISSIPVDNIGGGICYYKNSEDTTTMIKEDTISYLRLRILGSDTITPVDFDNQEWSLSLIFYD